jgi:FkbM family methyltransferase
MTSNIVHPGRGTGVAGRFPGGLLKRLEPGLFVDAGAAFGDKTRQMLDASPASRVVAYEPFAGNLAHLDRLAADDPRITVRPVALGARAGTAKFAAGPVVPPDAPPAFPIGASVVGKIVRGGAAAQDVPVVSLDEDLAGAHIRFLKLDVQGSERAVLDGARGLLDAGRIDYILCEFNGDLRLLRFLAARGYTMFDCLYMAWPSRWAPRNWFAAPAARTLPAWPPNIEVILATGAIARNVWPPVPMRSFAGYCAWFAFMRAFVCGLQTDLLCVHRSQAERFAQICFEAQTEMRARRAGRAPQNAAD